jgi:hypothetical protein
MSVLSLFKKPKPPENSWYPAAATYPSLFDLSGHASTLEGRAGLYALWHLGVRPQWLKVGAGTNLMDCARAAALAPQIAAFRGNGGLFMAWAFPAATQMPGIVLHLQTRLAPTLQYLSLPGNIVIDAAAAPTVFPLPPGTTER